MKINLKIFFLVISNISLLFSSQLIVKKHSWETIKTLEINNGPITALAFSPNEHYIVAASLNTIDIYAVNGNLIKRIDNAHEGKILDLKFSTSGHYLASSGTDKKIKIWDAYNNFTHRKTLYGHPIPCPTVDFIPDTNNLASGCSNGDIKIWNIFTAEVLWTIHTHRPINSMSFSYDRKSFTYGMNNSPEDTEKLNILDLSNNNIPKKLLYGYEDCFITSVKYSQFTDHMGCICSSSNEVLPTIYPDHSEILICLINFDISANNQITKKITDPELTNTFDFLSTDTLVAGYKNGKIKIWDFENSIITDSWQAHDTGINKLLFMPQTELIISAGNDGFIKIWRNN
ncbi:MAG: hypothetical protein P4L22_06935 [Candidatus Babeliales bacterium]|nr:hypothetical protein [Candidatus Babeliales bacterium]